MAYLLNYMLYGVMLVQTYMYYMCFPKDKPWLQSLVYSVVTLDTLQTALITYDAYVTFGSGYGNLNRLNEVKLLWIDMCFVDGIVAWLVEGFYAYRIWILSKSKPLVGTIIVLAFVQMGAAFAAGIRGVQAGVLSKLREKVFMYSCVWLGGSAVCDVLIACAMTWVLYRTKSTYRETQNVVRRIILLTMETGSLTALAASSDLTFFLIWPDRKVGHVIPGLILAKLYCNSLLVILNTRIRIPGSRGYHENTALAVELSTGLRSNSGGRISGRNSRMDRNVDTWVASPTEIVVSQETWTDRDHRKGSEDAKVQPIDHQV
ncbi:hypothetical protein PQX77_018048 [Marasmius sp. AFHP31]|nr:hypothetical protein PQX77_018048 [Marasmius sp. AFHP31]